MDKQSRKKFQDFVLAEMGMGGTVRFASRRYYGKALNTYDGVTVDLNNYKDAVRELIEKGQIIQRACTGDFKIAPFAEWDKANAGRRKQVYAYSTRSYRTSTPMVYHITHLVTSWGTFGNCSTGHVFEDFASAKEAMILDIETEINNERQRFEIRDLELAHNLEQARNINDSEEEPKGYR